MDQRPHGFPVRPSDLKQMPRYYAPASQGVYGNETDPQTPIYLVPASAMRDSSRVAGGSRDLSPHLANIRGEPVSIGSAPDEYKYAPFGGRSLAAGVPIGNAADSDSMYGSNRAVPRVIHEPLQGVQQANLPRSFNVPVSPSAESSFLRPGYSEDQMWIPRQIRPQPSPYPHGGFRASERFVDPGRRLEVSPYYVPLNSDRPHYGFSPPYHVVDGTGRVLNQPFMVDTHDYVDPRLPSWGIPARSDLEDGPVSGAREMQPAYTLVPCKDVEESLPYRPGDGYYLVRGPDSLPAASGGFEGGNAGIGRRPYGVPARQASMVPVNFPVSDLAKVKTTGGEGHDQVYSKVFYDPTSGRILVHDDPRLAPMASSSAYASTPSGAEATPSKVGGKPTEKSNHFDEVHRRKEEHGIDSKLSDTRSGPSVAGFPVQYLLPARDPSTNSNVSGAKESTGSRPPNVSGLIPVHPTSTTTTNAGHDDARSRIAGPFYLVEPLARSDRSKETFDHSSADSDSEHPRASRSNAAAKDDGSVRPVRLEHLSGSDKIKEVFDDGAASDKCAVVTRIIPVLSSDTEHSKDPKIKENVVSERLARSDQLPDTCKVIGNKESSQSSDKSKSSELTGTGNTKGTVRSTAKASKSKNDLLANIGKAFWSSKPKEKRTLTENVSGVDKSSKQGDGAVKAQKHDLLPNSGNAILSQPNQNSPLRSKLLPEAKSIDNERGSTVNAGAPSSLKHDAPGPVKPDALHPVRGDVSMSDNSSATDGGKLSQEINIIKDETNSKERVAEVASAEVVVEHPDLHPNFSGIQGREHALNSPNTGSAGAALENIEKDEAQVSCGEQIATVQCDDKVQASEALVEKAISRELESSDNKTVLSVDGDGTSSVSSDKAAIRIQAMYRGHVVRRLDVFKSLRTIKRVQTKLQSIRSRVGTNEDVCNLLANPKERLKITESAMALLLELDGLQGVHPLVREMRKCVAQEIVKFQDRIDAVMKGELVLPSADSSGNVARSSMLEETQLGVKEELDKAVVSGFDSESETEIREAVSQAGLQFVDRSESAAVVDAPSKEVPETPWDTEAQTLPVDGTVLEAPSLRWDTPSGAPSGKENIATSCVNESLVDLKSVSVDGGNPSSPSVEEFSARTTATPSSEHTVELAPDVEELEGEEHSVTPFRVDHLVETVQEAAYPTQEVGVKQTDTEESAETIQSREFGVESSLVHHTNSTTMESSPALFHAKEDLEGPSSLDILVDSCQETMNDNSSTELASPGVDASVQDKAVDSVIADSALGGIENEAATVLCDGKYYSGFDGGDRTVTDEMRVSLQGSGSGAGSRKDDVVGDSVVVETLPSLGDECGDVGVRKASESEPESQSLSRDSPPASGNDLGVTKVSVEDDLASGNESSEAVKYDISVGESPETVIIKDDSVKAAKVGENSENAIIVLPPGSPAGVEMGVQDSSRLSLEESEFTMRDDEVVLSRKEDGVRDAVSKESADVFVEVEDDGDGSLEHGEVSQTEPQHISRYSRVEVEVHDTSRLTSEETKVLSTDDELGLPCVESEVHDAVPREIPPDEDDHDGALEVPDKIHTEIAELSFKDQPGLGARVGVPRESFEILDEANATAQIPELSAVVSVLDVERPSGLDVGVHENFTTSPIADIEVALRDDVAESSCKLRGVHKGVSGEFPEVTAVEENADAATEVRERSESEISELSSESSLGEELVGCDGPSPLPVVETAPMGTSDSLRENKVDSIRKESAGLSAEEIEVPSKDGEVIEREGAVVTKIVESDETAAVEADATSVEEIGASCSSSYDEFATSRGEQEPEYSTGRTSSALEGRDTLLKQLVEENRRLQALFREVIQSNSDHKSTIQEMLDRLGKLEQLVKEQDKRKDKRKKSKKTNRQ